MKRSSLFTPALALALGLCASAALATTTTPVSEDFEGDAFASGVNGVTTNNLTWADTEGYTAVENGKLVVDAADTPTSASIDNTVAGKINGAFGRNAKFNATVTFVPATEAPTVADANNDLKFALYALASGASTNLCVLADGGSQTVTALSSVADQEIEIAFTAANTFTVAVNGGSPSSAFTFKNTGSISKLEFQGNGDVDTLGFSYDLVPFTVTFSGLASASYTVNGGTPVALTAAEVSSGSFTYYGEPTDVVVLTGVNGYKSGTATPAANGTTALALDTYSSNIADYFANGAGTQASPYQIATVADLIALKDAVANVEASRDKHYEQTANIDFANATFAGIGTYGETSPADGVPFAGTYDGQGYKISNIAFESKSYAGVFNQVNGGTIKNLTVENAMGAKGISIVGNAGNGATLQNLVAEGTFGSQSAPAGHNACGIVIRLSAGGTGTLVKDCTNNATIYGSYTKMAGICALTQEKISGGAVTFDGCANNGDLIMPSGSTPGRDGLAGIVAYVADATVLVDCSNTGAISSTLSSAKIGELVGWSQGSSLTDNGGNSGDAAKKLVYDQSGGTITGFQYATVDNGVATTVSGALAAGKTYLLEGNVAASETPVATLTAVGNSIAFDAALGYTFAGTVANSGAAGIPVASTSGTVTTYTAGYFPRTATAGQDGSAAHPFEIADLDDLQALQAAVANNVGRNLAYVQTADIALTGAWEGIGLKAGKDSAAQDSYNAAAFCGTYDGGNYTISNFQMENGTDYGALFNSIYQATIKNLKISWGSSTLCANASSSGGDTGATFVGVAKESTLQNLTALAGSVTTVSASKDMGGIVGYLMAGSTVESCTNELNVASLKGSRKCGGIAIITQGGTAGTAAVLRNCKNSGTSNGGSQDGGLVGYVGVATEIDGCENTAAVQLFQFVSGSVTASGVNKGNATVPSSNSSVSGLRFATVDGNVATFVADNALALNGSYKVMATGATATFAFAEAGTIAFDTALFTPTYAITAPGLVLSDSTSGTVKTYTAAVAASSYGDDPGEIPAIEISGGATHTLSDDEADYLNDLVQTKGGTAAAQAAIATAVESLTEQEFVDAALLNQDPTETGAGSYTFAITSVTKGNDGITVAATLTPAGKLLSTTINGTAALYVYNTTAREWQKVASKVFTFTFANPASPTAQTATQTYKGDYNLFKVVIE